MDLLPCPFCGPDGLLGHREPSHTVPYWRVVCEACCAEGPWQPTQAIAEKKWNKRTLPSAPEPVGRGDIK